MFSESLLNGAGIPAISHNRTLSETMTYRKTLDALVAATIVLFTLSSGFDYKV